MSNVIGRREFAKRADEVEKAAIWERMCEAAEREAEKTMETQCCELLEWDNPYEGCHVCFRKKGHRGNHYDPYTGHRWNETEVNQIEMFEYLAEERAKEAQEWKQKYPKLRVVK